MGIAVKKDTCYSIKLRGNCYLLPMNQIVTRNSVSEDIYEVTRYKRIGAPIYC